MHLGRLWRQGLVDREQRGRTLYYWISSGGVVGLLESAGELAKRAEGRLRWRESARRGGVRRVPRDPLQADGPTP